MHDIYLFCKGCLMYCSGLVTRLATGAVGLSARTSSFSVPRYINAKWLNENGFMNFPDLFSVTGIFILQELISIGLNVLEQRNFHDYSHFKIPRYPQVFPWRWGNWLQKSSGSFHAFIEKYWQSPHCTSHDPQPETDLQHILCSCQPVFTAKEALGQSEIFLWVNSKKY